MKLKLTNNADSLLAGPLAANTTTILVTPGEGVRFPALGANEFFPLTLIKTVDGEPVREIVHVTARTIDSMTVLRGQEGTTATTFLAGDKVSHRITAGAMGQKADLDGASFTGDVAMNDKKITQAVFVDCADAYSDVQSTPNTLDLTKARAHRWAPGVGPQTLTITGWPPLGAHGECFIYGINLGGATITIAGNPVQFRNDNGTFTSSNSLNSNHGVTLQTNGMNFILFFSPDGGITRYCKVF